jgi:hypothetical protein
MLLHCSSRREKTITTVVMMILTVVMFCLSATFFSMNFYLISNGLFNPRFIDLWGPETTTYIICQGINVCISCGLLHTSQTTVSVGCLGRLHCHLESLGCMGPPASRSACSSYPPCRRLAVRSESLPENSPLTHPPPQFRPS